MASRTAEEQRAMASFAANLVRLRRKHALTQEQFAELVGFSVRYVRRLERGEVDVGIRAIARIAKRLGVTPAIMVKTARLAPSKPGRPNAPRS